MMEFMKHGEFGGLVRKLSAQQAWIKTAELWRVFYCLFRACVAMAYPDRWNQGQDPDSFPNMTPQEEFVPLQRTSTKRGIISEQPISNA